MKWANIMAGIYDVDVGDWVQTLDKMWHRIVGIKFHARKGVKPHPCVGKHEKPKGLIRDWTITTTDGLVLNMMEISAYATEVEMSPGAFEYLPRKPGQSAIEDEKNLEFINPRWASDKFWANDEFKLLEQIIEKIKYRNEFLKSGWIDFSEDKWIDDNWADS